MNKILKLLRYSAILLSVALLAACQGAEVTDTSFALYYNGISEISPGTSVNVSPSWHGDTPGSFEISGIKRNGRDYQTGCFSVDTGTGLFSIHDSDELPTGKYVVGIACVSAGKRYVYDDALDIHIMKPVPDGIIVTPASLSVPLEDILDADAELPVAQIATDGSNHVKIKSFAIAHVYRNGLPADEMSDWFAVSPAGEFSINHVGTEEFMPGLYSFDFQLTTYVVGKEDEDGLFKKALLLDVTSAPVALSYPTPSAKVEKGYGGKSGEPTVKGSLSSLRYSLKGVTPDNSVGITVDDATGVIRFPETDDVTVGDEYCVSVTATNSYGTMDFDNVFSFVITAFISPVTKLVYADVPAVISGISFENAVTSVDGDDVEFAFVDLDEGLKGLQIDPVTGTVSCAKGVELVPGSYNVTVMARSIKTEVTSTFALEIIPNPYKFTYVRWGNNLGLTPLEEYGNQFRISESDGILTLPIVESDIPDGVPVKFKITHKSQNSNNPDGATIDGSTGQITLEYKGKHSAKSARVHFALITVTVGGNSEAAVTKDFPLFISHRGFAEGGYRAEYTPFVFRVNPKAGGTSLSPVVSREDGGEVNGFTLSYRRNIYFYAINDPLHKDGRPGDGNDTFMYTVWNKYYSARNALTNTGACSPVSYYGDKNAERGWLGLTACYINPDDLTMVVNPDKFSDDNGYPSGVVIGTMQYNINNIDPVNTGGTEIFPLIIWLDPDYKK